MNNLKDKICKITENASTTKTPPIIIRRNSCFINIAIIPRVPPSGIDPASPINICAGFELNHKNPSSDPIKHETKTEISPTSFIKGMYR